MSIEMTPSQPQVSCYELSAPVLGCLFGIAVTAYSGRHWVVLMGAIVGGFAGLACVAPSLFYQRVRRQDDPSAPASGQEV